MFPQFTLKAGGLDKQPNACNSCHHHKDTPTEALVGFLESVLPLASNTMDFDGLVLRNRSYRRFFENEPVTTETLRELVNLARLSPNSGNLQPLKYMLSNTPQRNAAIFPHLRWAGQLKDWDGPREGERPSAYIIVLGDTEITPLFAVDHGIAAQTIMLGATARGLGGCIIASIDRDALRRELRIPRRFEILLVLALGKPRETVIIEPIRSDRDTAYWRDAEGRHHVPKRPLDSIILD